MQNKRPNLKLCLTASTGGVYGKAQAWIFDLSPFVREIHLLTNKAKARQLSESFKVPQNVTLHPVKSLSTSLQIPFFRYWKKIPARYRIIKYYYKSILLINNLFSLLSEFILLLKLRKQNKIHMIECLSPINAFPAILASYLTKVPVVLYLIGKYGDRAHLYSPNSLHATLIDKIERFSILRSDLILVKSQQMKEYALKRGAKEVILAPGGVDVDLFNSDHIDTHKIQEVKKRYGLTESFVITFVGRFHKDKGIDLLLTAFEKIPDEKRHFKLLLVGNPYDDDKIDRDATVKLEKWLPNDRIAITGYLPHTKIPEVLAASNLIVLPSLDEGFCYAALEAVAMGIPLIATNKGNIAGFLQYGKFGYLIEPNPFHIKETIKNVYENYADALKKAKLGRDFVKLKYDKRRTTKTLVKILQSFFKRKIKTINGKMQ